jgi:hypothetical protein
MRLKVKSLSIKKIKLKKDSNQRKEKPKKKPKKKFKEEIEGKLDRKK